MIDEIKKGIAVISIGVLIAVGFTIINDRPVSPGFSEVEYYGGGLVWFHAPDATASGNGYYWFGDDLIEFLQEHPNWSIDCISVSDAIIEGNQQTNVGYYVIFDTE